MAVRMQLDGKTRPFAALAVALALCLVSTITPGCRLRGRIATEPSRRILGEPYPRHDDPDAFVFNDLPVNLYFHSQIPPWGTKIMQPVRARSAIMAKGRTCREAGLEGLRKLQRIALRYKADAVVNIRATWQGEQLGDELTFGCVALEDELVLIWEGALATVPVHPPAESEQDPATEESDGDPKTAEPAASNRLRELESLYYQGLITREEYLERRRTILDEL